MLKVGILGGGQLGRMLLQAAINYPVETYVMENDPACPAAHLSHHFTKGNIRNYEDVLNFGKNLDAITIEIENVNIEALEELEKLGISIYPKPAVLRIIANKINQKKYYTDNHIPTTPYILTHNIDELWRQVDFLPAVQKLAEGGYDGRGVQIINDKNDILKGFDALSILEKKANVQQEIAVIIAVNQQLEVAIYPAVEMVFDKTLNQLDYQICPVSLPEKLYWKLEAVAHAAVKNFNSPGIFAVEIFITPENDVLVNEIAPRVHNSGHHTIEGNFSSQFDMLWRVILNYPLGSTSCILPSVMINLVGKDNYTGTAYYDGLEEMLKIENAFFHIYGKKETKPGRKMGHVTIISHDKTDLSYKANKIKNNLSVISRENT